MGANRKQGQKAEWARKEKKEFGPSSFGLSIVDLFARSFYPPSQKSPCPTFRSPPTSRWFWIPTARVWDPTAERYPSTAQEINRFGAQAKHIRRVHPRTLDGRSFIEVARNKMERKGYQGRDLRDVRDGERFREGRLMRDAFLD